MNLSKLSVKRPVTIMMVTLIAILLGAVSLTKLPIDLLPNIEVPVAIVSTSYSGVGPQEIEKLISKPLEESVATINNIKEVSSISSEGSSIVIAEFNFGTDMDFAALEMREKVDLVKGYLPEDASAPMVLKIDPNAMPIIQASLSGEDLVELESFAEDIIKPRIERIEGVASVDIIGGFKKQVEIVLDQTKLQGYGLSIDYLSNILMAENLNLPGGEVRKGSQDLTIRTVGEFKTIDEIKKLPIALQTGGVINLSDIAQVKLSNKEESTINRTNGKSSIFITIQKQSGTNTVQVANLVNGEFERIRTEHPYIELESIVDQSDYIKQSINNVAKDALFGALLAIVILYIFLKNVRTTLIIGTSIPVSIIVTFILLYANKITLNLMTLGGLALGIGMLVDNAIVVLENIYRFRQDGYSRKEAAVKGATEVAMAVTASTLTTIAVFLPIVFVEGITSTIFRELALTVTLSLVASLVVSLTLIPMLSSKILRVKRNDDNEYEDYSKVSAKLFGTIDKIFEAIRLFYKRVLAWSLNHRKSTVLLAIVIFIGSMMSLITVGAEFFPEFDEGQFTINISLPVGSELDNTAQIVTEIEEILANTEDIDIVFSTIGRGSGFNLGGDETNVATVYVMTKSLSERDRSSSEIADEVRKQIKDIPGAEKQVQVTSMTMSSGGMGGTPISISVKGDDLDTLKSIGEDIVEIVKTVQGTTEVESNISEGIPEVQIQVNRMNASQYGLSSAQIANSVKTMISGKVATRYKFDGDEIDVVIKGDEIYRQSISNLEQMYIQTPTGISIPLNQVADVRIVRGPISIMREGQARVITVSSQIIGRDLKSIAEEIESELKDYDMPRGYTYELGGENKELNEAFEDLSLALILAIVLVYMILASQFESLLHPFVIMFSVPLALAGGALGLFISREALSVPAVIGVIILTGIVVNDSIVLIDYINTRRKMGEDRKEAIINAGPIRLRPILMTTLTTVLALVPIAIGIGEGAEALKPMGAVVIGGMTLSTVLILVFIPVMYTLFDDLSGFIRRKMFKRRG